MIDLTSLAWELAADAGDGQEATWRPIGAARPVAAALLGARDAGPGAGGDAALDKAGDLGLDAKTWWYRLRFDAPAGARILSFDGLATLAEAWLNGTRVLSSRNMFRRHDVDVSEWLRPEGNELKLRFASLDAALALRRPRPRWRVPMLAHQQLRWIRTTLLGRTPGWSPAAPVVGPWLPIRLSGDADRMPRLQGLRCGLAGEDGVLELSVALAPGDRARVRLEGHGSSVEASLHAVVDADADADAVRAAHAHVHAGAETRTLHHATLRVPAVRRWWPHTHGEPALYEASLVVEPDGRVPRTLPLGAVGFRTIAFDTHGDRVRVLVNGEPVFCRGGCWTPLDPLTLRGSADAYDRAIDQARASGANMLRLSGAMAYESDAFFDACDRAGLLVWQDLMFANMDYPADDADFLAEVDAELEQQLGALQRHPCLAVVCGNSEVEQQAAMSGAAREAWAPALFHQHIAQRVHDRLGDAQPYWPSSSHGGDFPFQPSAGTASYYGVGAYERALDDATHSGLRFATECLAFANIPDDAALQRLNGDTVPRTHQPRWKARVPRDLGAGWDFDDVRDHYVERLFGLRADDIRYADAPRHLRLGRAASAEAIAAAFTRWRQPGSVCGGALVWFWRDLWAGAGWGVVDESGQPKAAYHALKRVSQPLHLGLVDDGLNGLFVHLVNESGKTLSGTLSITFYRDGERQVAQATQAVELAPRTSLKQSALTGLNGFADLNWTYRFGPAMADLAVARWRRADDETDKAADDGREGDLHGGLDRPLDSEIDTLCFLDAASVRQPGDIGLGGHARALPDGRMQVRLSTRAAARSVWFEADGWRPDEEYFDLAPGAERSVTFTPPPGKRRTWRTLVGALNQRDSSALTLVPAAPPPTAIP